MKGLEPKEEMDVLMVNPFFIPYAGGTEKVIYEVSRRLVNDHGFKITVLTTRMKGTKKEEEIDGIRVVRASAIIIKNLPHPFPPPYAIAPSESKHLMRETKWHKVVHFHNRFFYNPIDFLIVKKLGKTLALTLHNSRPEGIDPLTDLLGCTYDDTIGRIIFDTCDYITAVSRDTLEKTLAPEFRKKARVIYNGVDEKRFNPRVDGSEMRERLGIGDSIMVLTVARLVEQKGLKYLIEAMNRVRNLDIRLVIKGKGPKEKELKRQVKKLGLENGVIFFTERLSEEDLVKLYRASDIFALPSLYEPFGLVVAEAMACGKPVVASRIGGLKELVTSETGFLVEPRNPEDLAGRIALLASHPEMRKRMGKRARERIEKYFTWDKIAKDYKEFYDEIMG